MPTYDTGCDLAIEALNARRTGTLLRPIWKTLMPSGTSVINDEQLAAIRKQTRDAREALWGMQPELDAKEAESDD